MKVLGSEQLSDNCYLIRSPLTETLAPMQYIRLSGKHYCVPLLEQSDHLQWLSSVLPQPDFGSTEIRQHARGYPFDPQNCRLILCQQLFTAQGIYLLQQNRKHLPGCKPMVFIDWEDMALPYGPSRFIIDSLPAYTTGNLLLLEDWGIPGRICTTSPGGFDGAFHTMVAGYIRQHSLSAAQVLFLGEKRWHQALSARIFQI